MTAMYFITTLSYGLSFSPASCSCLQHGDPEILLLCCRVCLSKLNKWENIFNNSNLGIDDITTDCKQELLVGKGVGVVSYNPSKLHS